MAKTQRLRRQQQHGGVKLKNAAKRGFQAVYDMVASQGTTFKLLTYSSLKGFMFKMDVAPEDSEYVALDEHHRFTKPVTSFILKFAVITGNRSDLSLKKFKGKSKASESDESFVAEAKLQQHIWKESVLGGRPEICPSVANYSVFDTNQSTALCDFFVHTKKTDEVTKELFAYLRDAVLSPLSDYTRNVPTRGDDEAVPLKEQVKLGVILMPAISHSTTYYDFQDMKDGSKLGPLTVDPLQKRNLHAYLVANTVRLFVQIGVIHYDLHGGNSLASVTEDGQLKSFLIDFGRASNVIDGKDDEYLTRIEKEMMKTAKEKSLDSFFFLTDPANRATDDMKVQFTFGVMEFLKDTDKEKLHAFFNVSDPNSYQMSWWEDYGKDRQISLLAFDTLQQSMLAKGTGLAPTTIRAYERQGNLPSFNDTMMRSFPKLPTEFGETKRKRYDSVADLGLPSNYSPAFPSMTRRESPKKRQRFLGLFGGSRTKRRFHKRKGRKSRHNPIFSL